uniref:Uncharacterized protein n=1 Tax=Arundo donax TaxID=35708 RepID=A0A0A9BU14_ARUDO
MSNEIIQGHPMPVGSACRSVLFTNAPVLLAVL